MYLKIVKSNLDWETKNFKRGEYLKISGIIDTKIYWIERGSICISIEDDLE